MEFSFDVLGRELFESLLTIDPVRASEMGSSRHDHTLPSGGPDRFHRKVEELERAARAVAGPGRPDLSPEQALDAELLGQTAALERFALDQGTYLRAGGDPALEVGSALDPLFSRESRPAVHRVEAMQARLEQVPRYLREARERFVRPVEYWTRAALRSCRATSDYLGEIREAVPGILAGAVPPSDAAARARGFATTVASAQASLRAFAEFLEGDVLPWSTASLAMGPEAFRELIRLRRLGVSVEELAEIGREAWHRLGREYEQELAAMFPGAGRDRAEELWGETAPSDFEAILETYRRAVEESRVFVKEAFGLEPPRPDRLEVRPTPGYLESVIPSAAYFEPERFTPGTALGIYMVTRPEGGKDRTEHAPGMIYNTSCHEGYPGHHLQLCHANAHPSPIRALVTGDEFCEGWAHYAEEAMYDTGFRPVPGTRAAQIKDAMFRALRIQVDIGLQTGELSTREAAAMLEEKGRISAHRAAGEVNWYTFKPGYPLGYLTGKILIRKMRDDWCARGGDLVGFHRNILEGGTMPVWAHRVSLGLEKLEGGGRLPVGEGLVGRSGDPDRGASASCDARTGRDVDGARANPRTPDVPGDRSSPAGPGGCF